MTQLTSRKNKENAVMDIQIAMADPFYDPYQRHSYLSYDRCSGRASRPQVAGVFLWEEWREEFSNYIRASSWYKR